MIARLLAGPFGSWILAAIAGLVLALAAMTTTKHVQLAGARGELAACAGTNDRLQARVAIQNDLVERLGAECREKGSAAAAAALRALARPEPPGEGAGPEALNAWLRKRLSRG